MLFYTCSNLFGQNERSISYSASLLVSANDMPVSNGQLVVLPNMGLFVVDGNTFFSIDEKRCPDINRFKVLENFDFDEVIVNDNDLLVKSGEFLMLLGDKRTEILTEFDTECFYLFCGLDSVVNVVSKDDNNNYSWYKYDRRSGDVQLYMKHEEPITKIISGKGVDYCMVGNKIYYVMGDECNELVSSKQSLYDMVLLSEGLMFCTDTTLFLLEEDSYSPIVEGEFVRLYNDGELVYAVLKNGNIWKIVKQNPLYHN